MRTEATVPGGGGGRGGFALAMVVLLLFAVAMAGATAYQVVRVEAELAVGAEEANDALAVAQGGLERYFAESLGPPDTVAYTVGGGTATVTPRKVGVVNADTDLYLVRSEGAVTDARYPASPARRTVSQYARLHHQPVVDTAALVGAYGGAVTVSTAYDAYPEVDGDDHGAHTGWCSSISTRHLYGIAKPGSAPSPASRIDGQPSDYVTLASPAGTVAAAAVRWDVLQNPSQPVGPWDHPYWPSSVFSTYPDSFPVVRYEGDLYATSAYSGRGALIVTGTLHILYGFHWDGIVLAGSISPFYLGYYSGSVYRSSIDGVLVGGLDGGSSTSGFTVQNLQIRYNRCYAWRANQSLAYLEPLDGTWWEGL